MIEAAVRALLELFQMYDCVLVGKGNGAGLIARSMLEDSLTDEIIAGVILLAPEEVVPGQLTSPSSLACSSQKRYPSVLLVLSADRSWTHAFKGWPSPVANKEVSGAVRDLATLLSKFDGEAATTVTHFTVAVLLVADLKRCAHEASRNPVPRSLPDRTLRLCDEL